VGKSSLLNALVGSRIARTSRTPGKTTQVNVYRLPQGYLLDLPGYGYALASRSERRRFRHLVEGVIRDRPTVRGVLWLLDIRHRPSTDDLAMGRILAEGGHPTIIALTKADKLPRARQLSAGQDRAADLGVTADAVLPVSATRPLGLVGLADRLVALLHAAAQGSPEPVGG
jgi:GTP-binding protein